MPRGLFGDPNFPLGADIELCGARKVLARSAGDGDFSGQSGCRHGGRPAKHTLFGVQGTGDCGAGDECRNVVEAAGVLRSAAQLLADKVTVVDPEEGWLSCRDLGRGRMAAVEKIRAVIEKAREQNQLRMPSLKPRCCNPWAWT